MPTFVPAVDLKIISFHRENHRYRIHFSLNKAFKGNVVNRTLHENSLEITQTVCLNGSNLYFYSSLAQIKKNIQPKFEVLYEK